MIAFVGAPHRIDDRGSHVAKALKAIGFEQYYQAEQKGWVLYLEGATDLAILRAFARALGHPAAAHLERPFVHYIGNDIRRAWEHFFGLRESKPDLVGVMLTDRLDRKRESSDALLDFMWERREIENYLCFPEVLEAYAEHLARDQAAGELFEAPQADRYRQAMSEAIAERVPPIALRDRAERWWRDVKASDDFLDPVFESFFRSLELPNLMRKSDYHRLAGDVPAELLADEIGEKLDRIAEVAGRARPLG